MNARTQVRSRIATILRPRNVLLALGVVVLAGCQLPPPPPPPPAPASSIVFDGSPKTDAPPATLGSFAMTPFAADDQPLSTDVFDVAGPTGTLGFGAKVSHFRIGKGWSSWSHGYTGDVYYTNGAVNLTLTLPPNTGAFAFYVEPNNFALFDVTATAQDGITSNSVPVSGLGGATYFGFYGTGGATITSITISSATAFAVGEFGIAATGHLLTELSDVHTWVTEKRFDFHGVPLDFRAELLENGTPVAAGVTRCVADLPLLPLFAREVTVSWDAFAPVPVNSGDVLALRISTRVGTNADDSPCQGDEQGDEVDAAGNHHHHHHHDDSVRLYYDGSHQPSGFDLTITPDPAADIFLHSDGTICGLFDSFHVTSRTLDANAPAADFSRCKDSPAVALDGGNSWQEVGVWSMAPRP
jgi:hypothetical protein